MDYQSQLREIEQKIAHHQRIKDEQQILITGYYAQRRKIQRLIKLGHAFIGAKDAVNPVISDSSKPISERLNALTDDRRQLGLQPPEPAPAASSISAADRQFYDWVMAEKRDLTPEQQARYNDVSYRLSEERRNPK